MPEIARFTDPESPLKIEYSRAALEQIRERAIDGLLALPRIGMGVGGLLLGSRQNGVVRLLNSIEIPCSHAAGPSFLLTDAEKKHAAELIAGAGEHGVIGWYCSKTRGTAVLGDAEIALHRELFPGPEQIAMVLRPSTVSATRAAFYFPDDKGALIRGMECDVEEWRSAEPEPEIARPEIARPEIAEEEEKYALISDEPAPPQPAEPLVAAPLAEAPAIPVATPAPPPDLPSPPAALRATGPDLFAFAAGPAPRKKVPGWLLGVAACLALGAAAFLTQNTWYPRPPLTLTSMESNSKLVIRWNPDAFRGIDHASLSLNDGGNLQSLPLDRYQLNQGVYIYEPKSERVTTRLSAGDISAIAVWFAPPPKEPEPATPDAAAPGDASPNPAAQTPAPNKK